MSEYWDFLHIPFAICRDTCIMCNVMATGFLWPAFRERVRALMVGKSMAGTATASGLPRNAIRDILLGHEPHLSRADAVARVLGFRLEISPADPRSDGPTDVTLSREQYERLREALAVLDEVAGPRPRRGKRIRRTR